MLVKICGITRADDAEAAVEAGAGAIGFVFWPESPRFIDPYRARSIASTLPPFVTAVGVFVNQPLQYVNAVASLLRLGAVQLHGDETPEYAAAVSSPVIKAVSFGPVKRGGTGRTIDWTGASALAAQRKILLAGGLTPDNVMEAIAQVRPFGIDVSSGVERTPGVKDHPRMRALFEALSAMTAGRERLRSSARL